MAHLWLCTLLFTATQDAGVPPGKVWPGFRGAGPGTTVACDLPLAWTVRGRKNFAWTVRLPGYGQSSPVVWVDKVFVTAVEGEFKERLLLIALDLSSGTQLWQREFVGTQKVPDGDTVSRGAPTPAVDAERVYTLFESGDLFALDHEGKELWRRSLVAEYGEFQGPHGYGSSPAQTDNALIVQVSHRGPSYLLAIDKATGKNLWKRDLPMQTAWSSPTLVKRGGRTEILVNSVGSVQAFDAKDGCQLWIIDGLEGNSTCSPSSDGTLAVIGSRELHANLAIRLGGAGHVSQTHVAWRAKNVTSAYGSPLIHRGHVYFVNPAGVATCLDLQTGAPRWATRLPNTCWASPLGAGDRVYFFTKEGATVVVRAGPVLERLAESELSTTDIVYGIAAVDGKILIRSGRSLACVGSRGPDSSRAPTGQ
jgi:outer membrane protein assembly factor BamB